MAKINTNWCDVRTTRMPHPPPRRENMNFFLATLVNVLVIATATSYCSETVRLLHSFPPEKPLEKRFNRVFTFSEGHQRLSKWGSLSASLKAHKPQNQNPPKQKNKPCINKSPVIDVNEPLLPPDPLVPQKPCCCKCVVQ